MPESKIFTVSDALDLQLLQGQRGVIDQQIAAIINSYGVEGPAQIITDDKGRWVGIQATPEPSKLNLVPDASGDEAPKDFEVVVNNVDTGPSKKKKTS